MNYGLYESPFGSCYLAFNAEGVTALIFADSAESAVVDLQERFPTRTFIEEAGQANTLGDQIFKQKHAVKLCLQGTDFQQSVWKVLQEIPTGETRTYAQVAAAIGKPKAVRAVGTAVGANPVAYLIPCHRVVRTDGGLGGYRWGLAIKRKMLLEEGICIHA